MLRSAVTATLPDGWVIGVSVRRNSNPATVFYLAAIADRDDAVATVRRCANIAEEEDVSALPVAARLLALRGLACGEIRIVGKRHR